MENPTKRKVREAEHFLSMMKQTLEDDNTFSYNLSAFLSAARSITLYLQKQYAHRNGFAEWYCTYKIKMPADPELKYLNKARADDIHTEYVQTGITREIKVNLGLLLVKEGVSVAEQAKEPEYKPTAKSSPRTVRRFFPKFEQVDVIEFCENQLVKLTRIVEKCENRFS
ncbi:MAG: hypothetical protein JW732_01050 [Dehalococcoidia bacterium]|nr:hypothetical protein [Dehalococcoidia bacterium]